MLTYKNEAAFSKALVTALRNKGWFVQRIESGETGKGIPDIYCIDRKKRAHWLELKRVKHNINDCERIPWRPGQQSWLNEVADRGQSVKTLCCFNDGILIIWHYGIHSGNLVIVDQHKYVKDIGEFIKWMTSL